MRPIYGNFVVELENVIRKVGANYKQKEKKTEDSFLFECEKHLTIVIYL